MSSIDIAGNTHQAAGAPGGGQFAGRVNSRPDTVLKEDSSVTVCSMHGGAWGKEPSCTNCADEYGQPIEYPFPALRDGIRAHEVDLNLYWAANPEGPSPANPNGGVWHLVAHLIRTDDAGSPDTDTSAQLFNISVGVPPRGLELNGDDRWSMDTAPAWVRASAIHTLRKLSSAETAMDTGIAIAERADREMLALSGQRPIRPAND